MTKTEAIQRNNAFIENYLQKSVYPSWSWAKLTPSEQFTCEDVICCTPLTGLRTDDQRFTVLNRVYHAFLCGTGYLATGWRE